jgi:cytochrome c oxidase subunit 3
MDHAANLPVPSGLKQPYHLVDPSPWPIIGAFGAGGLLTGIVLAAHGKGSALLIVALLATLVNTFMWWRDVVKESRTPGLHTPAVRLGLRYGVMLFISSEVMFFVGFFWAFFHFAIYPEHVLSADTAAHVANAIWPPPGIHTFDPFKVPVINTMILLLSGCTATWAHHAIIEGDNKTSIKALLITVCLGLSFTALQAYEYSEAPFHLNGGGIYPAVFFLATGFHGFHVIIGTTFLLVCLLRARAGHFSPERHFGFEAAAWYWHFVDVVWLFLFVFIYIWAQGLPME